MLCGLGHGWVIPVDGRVDALGPGFDNRATRRRSRRVRVAQPSTLHTAIRVGPGLWSESRDSVDTGLDDECTCQFRCAAESQHFVKLGKHGVLRCRQHTQMDDGTALSIQEHDAPENSCLW